MQIFPDRCYVCIDYYASKTIPKRVVINRAAAVSVKHAADADIWR